MLQTADEVFITSSTKDVLAVSGVDDRDLPAPGPVTRRAAEIFSRLRGAGRPVSAGLRVEPMTDAELASYLQVSLEGYVRQRVDLGGERPHELARRIAEEQYAGFFPDGVPAEGHVLFTGSDAGTGATVGRLWLHARQRQGAGTSVWVYFVEVDEGRRGQGWGRALMTYAEQWARERGSSEIGLNVFGGNTAARRLYTSLGYGERSVTMSRRLAP